MVAFRRAVVLTTACFLLGVVFLCIPVVSPILFPAVRPAPTEDYNRVERYFAAWWEAPTSVKLLLHADMAACIVATTTKLATYTEAAYYFDGGSLILLIFAVTLYVSSLVPGLTMLHPESKPSRMPGAAWFLREAKAEVDSLLHPTAETIPPLTPPERRESFDIVGATVTLIGLCLFGVVLLQVGEWYADKLYRDAVAVEAAKEKEAKRQ